MDDNLRDLDHLPANQAGPTNAAHDSPELLCGGANFGDSEHHRQIRGKPYLSARLDVVETVRGRHSPLVGNLGGNVRSKEEDKSE